MYWMWFMELYGDVFVVDAQALAAATSNPPTAGHG